MHSFALVASVGVLAVGSVALAEFDPGPNVRFSTEFGDGGNNGSDGNHYTLGEDDVRVDISTFFAGSSLYYVNLHAPYEEQNPSGLAFWSPNEEDPTVPEGADNSTWFETIDPFEYPGFTLYSYHQFPEFRGGFVPPETQYLGLRLDDGRYGFVQIAYDDDDSRYRLAGWALQREAEDSGFTTFDVRTAVPTPSGASLLGLGAIGCLRRRRDG